MTEMGALGLYNISVHSFAAKLKGVVTMGVVAALTAHPSPSMPAGRVRTLSLLHLRFDSRV